VGRGEPMRHLLHHADQVRKGLLPHDALPRLRHSPKLFHWESQSTTSDTSPTGERYTNHWRDGSHVLLFVREYRTSRFGSAMPYMALGPASYVQHEGSRPMAVKWRLHTPMPAELFEDARVAAG
jgi:Domain of unknown function (DUF3427)